MSLQNQEAEFRGMKIATLLSIRAIKVLISMCPDPTQEKVALMVN